METSAIIIGAGVIGASVAYRLAQSGARVTVVDAGRSGATTASFGWINASYFLNEDHFKLRVEAIAAYHRLSEDLKLPLSWSGTLYWDDAGTLESRAQELNRLGYDATLLDADQFANLEPHVAEPPEQSMFLSQEGVAEPSALAGVLLSGAQGFGARILRGVRVEGFVEQASDGQALATSAGILKAHDVIVTAGVESRDVLARVGFQLPMLHRPALVIQTAPVPPLLSHVLVSDIGEVRQRPDGCLIMPTSIGHQQNTEDALPSDLMAAADAALLRLQSLLPETKMTLAQTWLAERPMPGDGLPAVGSVQPGIYVATMHSGVTLAALMGELVSSEILQGESNRTHAWLAPYRPSRFETSH